MNDSNSSMECRLLVRATPMYAAEGADGRGRVSAATHAAQGGHARIVPAVDHTVGDEPRQATLGGDRVGQFEAGELGLARLVAGERQVTEVPVVQRPVAVEFERAERMGDPFDGVALTVRPVVRRIDHPLVARAPVMTAADAVHHRIAELHVLVLHVDLGAEHPRSVGELAGAHAPQQVEVLVDRAVAIRALDARLP